MLVKCSFCGKQKIVDNGLYGSPLFRCDICGNLFYDNKIKEPALNPPPVNAREKLSIFIYVGAFLGLVFTILGISGIFTNETDYLFFLILGIFVDVGSVFLIWSTYQDKKNRQKDYIALLKASHQRLSKLSYQEQLIVASNGSAEVTSLLKQYNLSHNLDYALDVDNILHNCELASNTDKKEEKQEFIKTVDGIREIYINENTDDRNDFKLFCRKCGTELLLDSDFCHRCGEKVETR